MFTVICFYMSVSSVLALSPTTFTSVFLGSTWLYLTVLGAARAVFSILLSTSNSSVSSLVYTCTEIFLDSVLNVNSTAIFLGSSGLFLMMMMVLALSVVVVSVLLQHVDRLELVSGNHLVNLFLMSFGAVRVVCPAFCCSTAISSVSALSLYTFTVIFSDSAWLFS